MFNKIKKNGFTLMEIMIVIAIIGILAVVLIPKGFMSKENAKENGVDLNSKALQSVVTSLIDGYVVDE